MHTSEYKHIRRVKEREFFFYFFFILSVYISSTARDFRHSSSTARIFGHSRTPSRLISRLFESGSSPRLVGQEKAPHLYCPLSLPCSSWPRQFYSCTCETIESIRIPHNTRHAGFNELYLNLPRTGSVYATEPIRLFTDG